ncbi:NAD(+) diphosphatase [Zwartia sp.]|uniref:NAD(+) diphosphatase n=1 Tax=Zwartia sp. TaxID=2978004 RepID=UPI0027218C0A|nr:NAD(+) diphosphatase [Zwartia sp.]MDO9023806.1 NAD(+) diphosphatase [Zwartia sp.]
MSDSSYWLIRCGNEVLISIDEQGNEMFPQARMADFGHIEQPLKIGHWNGVSCYAIETEQIPEHIMGELRNVRSLYASAGPDLFALAGRGTQLIDWEKNHRFCGHCGTPTIMKKTELALECPACRLTAYPRISPAVMVLIERGDELMLARSPHFRPGVFSALAGFVEPGETLEQCAVREVREEVGLEITNLRYYTSQSWPFPNSLMIAFFADYAGGDITPDPTEIEAAGWFERSALPPLPDHVSIARQLIDASCRMYTGQ